MSLVVPIFDEFVRKIDAIAALCKASHDGLKVFAYDLTAHEAPQLRHLVPVLGHEPFAALSARCLSHESFLILEQRLIEKLSFFEWDYTVVQDLQVDGIAPVEIGQVLPHCIALKLGELCDVD